MRVTLRRNAVGYPQQSGLKMCGPLEDWPDDTFPPQCALCHTCITPGDKYAILLPITVVCLSCVTTKRRGLEA